MEPASDPEAHKLPFDLQSKERVLLFTRRHPVYFIANLAKYTLFTVVLIVAILWLAAATSGSGSLFGKVALVLSLVWFAFWAFRAAFAWYRWNNDVWVVTNQRIVDSTKTSPFSHRIASADLVDVEDIAVHRSGLLPTMFKFGDVQLQTAAERENFILAGIPEPQKVLGLVDSQRDTARRELGQVGRTLS